MTARHCWRYFWWWIIWAHGGRFSVLLNIYPTDWMENDIYSVEPKLWLTKRFPSACECIYYVNIQLYFSLPWNMKIHIIVQESLCVSMMYAYISPYVNNSNKWRVSQWNMDVLRRKFQIDVCPLPVDQFRPKHLWRRTYVQNSIGRPQCVFKNVFTDRQTDIQTKWFHNYANRSVITVMMMMPTHLKN